jgi:quinol monooxygenase YgiN
MTATIEVIRFEVPPEAADRFRDARRSVNEAVRTHHDGYLGSALIRVDETVWYLIVEFADGESLRSISQWVADRPEFAAFVGLATAPPDLVIGTVEVDDRCATP